MNNKKYLLTIGLLLLTALALKAQQQRLKFDSSYINANKIEQIDCIQSSKSGRKITLSYHQNGSLNTYIEESQNEFLRLSFSLDGKISQSIQKNGSNGRFLLEKYFYYESNGSFPSKTKMDKELEKHFSGNLTSTDTLVTVIHFVELNRLGKVQRIHSMCYNSDSDKVTNYRYGDEEELVRCEVDYVGLDFIDATEQTIYEYDAGLLIKWVRTSDFMQLDESLELVYNNEGKVKSSSFFSTDMKSPIVTKTQYDTLGREIASCSNVSGKESCTRRVYDENGLVVAIFVDGVVEYHVNHTFR